MREQRGQTAAEYLGVLLLVAVIVAAIAGLGIGSAIAGGVGGAVCRIAEQPCADDGAGDPRAAESDGDGTFDGDEYAGGTDPAQGVAPLTEENALRPWERVGISEDDWHDLEDEILDEVDPGGWEGFLFGNAYRGVTLDEDGELVLLEVEQAGLSPGPLLRVPGVGGRALSASGAAAAQPDDAL